MVVTADGAALHVRVTGSDPPLLLVHGAGVDSDSWGPLVDDLAGDFRVITYDRRGFSRSTGEATSRWDRHARDAAAVLSQLDATPAVVVGWSAGALVALDLAVRRPEMVSRLVLLEPGLHGALHPTRSFLRAWLATQVSGVVRGPEAAADRFMTWVYGFRHGPSLWPEQPAERRAAVRANGRSMLVELRGAGRDRHLTGRRLRALPMPVTIAYGERTQDWFEICAKAAVRRMPQARLVTIPGGNHVPAVTPRDIAAAIRGSAATHGAPDGRRPG